MANKERGQVDIIVDDKTFTLELQYDGVCQIEALFGGRGINSLLADFASERASLSLVRGFMWAMLRVHHPKVDLIEVGRLIQAYGLAKGGQAVGEVLTATEWLNTSKDEAPLPQTAA